MTIPERVKEELSTKYCIKVSKIGTSITLNNTRRNISQLYQFRIICYKLTNMLSFECVIQYLLLLHPKRIL